MSLLVVGSLVGCGGRASLSVTAGGEFVSLNAALRLIVAGGDLDPLSVTPRSVQVFDASGRVLDHVTNVQDNVVDVFLVIDQELWQKPPGEVQVVVAGSPSLHAMRDRRGLRLGASTAVRFSLQPSLDAGLAPRLVSVGGQVLPVDGEVSFDRELKLVFSGALDPATVAPQTCPLTHRRAGLSLSPVLPDCRWILVGDRFELTLDVGEERGALRLSTRELGIRGPRGAAPSPQVQVDLVARS